MTQTSYNLVNVDTTQVWSGSQLTLHLKVNARIEDQQLFFQFLQSAWRHPVELMKEMEGHSLLGSSGTVFNLDRNAKTFTGSAQALDAFCSAFADHLVMGSSHQFGVKSPLSSHQVRMRQHRPADLFQFRMG